MSNLRSYLIPLFNQSMAYLSILFICLSSIVLNAKNQEFVQKNDSDKGMFSIQFSWNNESFSKTTTIEVVYQKKSFLSKAKSSGQEILYASRNDFINLELSEGEYELIALKLMGKDFGYNKYLRVPIEESFTIKKGKITNGGLIFLVRENMDSLKVMTLKMDNTKDVKHYVRIFKPVFSGQLDSLFPAWKFLENETVNNMVNAYAENLVKRQKASKNKKVIYTYATLGIAIKLFRDQEGNISDYKMIPTPSYQQIEKMTLKGDKIICTLANGGFLYGDDSGLEYIPMPENLETIPQLYIADNNFLLIEGNFNIFSSDDQFNWREQLEYNISKSEMGKFFSTPSYANFYKGKKHLYIYSNASGKQKRLLQSRRDVIDFKEIPLSEEVKRVPMVSETSTKIILGPDLKLNATAKRPAYLYIKDHNDDTWVVRNLPRGDCKRFYPGEDESILYTECSTNNWYESHDYGLTWSKWVASK